VVIEQVISEKCRECGGKLIRIKWNVVSDVLCCDNYNCPKLHRPPGHYTRSEATALERRVRKEEELKNNSAYLERRRWAEAGCRRASMLPIHCLCAFT